MSWGNATSQAGLEKGDTIAGDVYPEIVKPVTHEYIFINDEANKRGLVYTVGGQFKEVVSIQNSLEGNYEVYRWTKYFSDGQFIGFDQNDAFWTIDKGTYRKYNLNFAVVQTTNARPKELGIMVRNRLSASQWHYEIEYPDGIYIYDGTKSALKETGLLRVSATTIMQNTGVKVIAYTVAEELPVQPNEKKKFKLATAAEWTKPQDQFGPVRVVGVERLPTLVAQYGDAVLGPDGSVYTWMRTDTEYKILRWQWVE